MEGLARTSQANLAAMIDKSSVAFIICDPNLPDTPIIHCNTAFIELTGYDRDEIIGHNCRFLAGPETEADKSQKLADAIREHQPVLVHLTNHKKDGTPFCNAVMISPILGDEGELAYFLGSQLEVPLNAKSAVTSRNKLATKLVKKLSPQQKRVLTLVAKGYMNKQIAHDLAISERTVKMHRAEAFAKLKVATTAEAIRLAVEAGL
ncbi:MAG: PAS domain-containing protein [Acidimicrobiales bacterium]|nr:PAS domain-containing protein [Hyphomonadaceae bacterium]RZV40933.1 MAG: PAS domain-containing protein [Acidimicrobiales bacterium]